MFIEVRDNITGNYYYLNSKNICYFYIKANEYGKSQYTIALSNGKEIVVTHKQWNRIRRIIESV